MTDTYTLRGGPNFADPDPSNPDETFDTLDAAVYEWLRRRNDWTGHWPLWGDGMGRDDAIVVLGSETDTSDVWSLIDAFLWTDRDLTELTDYMDPAEIDKEPIGSPDDSLHRQIWLAAGWHRTFDMFGSNQMWSEHQGFGWIRFVDGTDEFDLAAMRVGPDWADEAVEALEDTGMIRWIDGQPHLVGIDVLLHRRRGGFAT